jgi:hypothetical protein
MVYGDNDGGREPCPNGKKHRYRTAGVEVQAFRERLVEITSGRA